MHNEPANKSSILGVFKPIPPTLWIAAPLLIAAIFSVLAIGESLWIDELHTAWSISGSLSAALERIAAGNQTPTYFLSLFALGQTLGLNHWVLRAPSIVCWLASIVLLAVILNRCRIVAGTPAYMPIVLLWVVLDRIQLFYATEARPYAAVQLATLGGWACMWLAATSPKESSTSVAYKWLWVASASLAIYLQPTAALATVWQLLAGTWLVLIRTPDDATGMVVRSVRASSGGLILRAWILPIVVLSIITSPIVIAMVPVWNRRQQWEVFGSAPSWAAATSLFPLLPILGTILPLILLIQLPRFRILSVARFLRIQAGLPINGTIPKKRLILKYGPSSRQIIFWSFAAFGPWVSGWLISALEIAPIYHRRYLIACSIPLVILGVCLLKKIPGRRARITISIVALVAILIQQGTLTQVWARGYWIGYLRGEHWQAASQFIGRQLVNGDIVWCSSQLIEGNTPEWPLPKQLADYLALPLESLYRIRANVSGQSATIVPLPNHSQQWSRAFLDSSRSADHRGWIVFRGLPRDLENRLQRVQTICASQGTSVQFDQLRSFGRVSTARLVVRTIAPNSETGL